MSHQRKLDSIRTATYVRGFTIVELLIVIVVIAVLAALVLNAFSGVQKKAVETVLKADLSNANKQLKLYQAEHEAYPQSNDCSATPAASSICLKSSGTNTFTAFQTDNTTTPPTFCLTATNNDINYLMRSDGGSGAGSCSGTMANGTTCPTGYIVVPGSSTYGTSDFCAMKYEAKNVSGVATSQAASSPWDNISQTTALTTASAACSGCRLITEAEYLTIVQNVLSVPSNWSSGTVGSGFIYSGHNDGYPNNTLSADSNDANGYTDTDNSSPSNQRRTLALSNGEVIWDLAGNVWEWTSGTSTTGQPGIVGEPGYYWKEWVETSTSGSLSPNPSPSYGVAAASGWGSVQGIGQLNSKASETALRGFLRGGSYGSSSPAGVSALYLKSAPSAVSTSFGFRVSR